MDILLLNDDGASSEVLGVLRDHLAQSGHDVFAFIPAQDRSGNGCATSFHSAIALRRRSEWQVEVKGSPVDCAVLGLEWFRTVRGALPALCLSGINVGLNFGGCVPFSGTVGAATMAAWKGVRSISFSTTSHVVETLPVLDVLLHWINTSILPIDSCLNVNVVNPRPRTFELDRPMSKADIPYVAKMVMGGEARLMPSSPDYRLEFELMLGLVGWQTGLAATITYESELCKLGEFITRAEIS